jgi:hypothetical protein
VRCDAKEDPPLTTRLEDQPEVPVLQVTNPAVDQPGRPAGRATREVGAFEQGNLQSTKGGVARHARTGYSAADYDDVETALPKAFSCLSTPGDVRHAVVRNGSGRSGSLWQARGGWSGMVPNATHGRRIR